MKNIFFILLFVSGFARAQCVNTVHDTCLSSTALLSVSLSCGSLYSSSWAGMGGETVLNIATGAANAINLSPGIHVFKFSGITTAGASVSGLDTITVFTSVLPAPIVQTITVPQVCPAIPADRTVISISELPGGTKQILFNRGLPQSF